MEEKNNIYPEKKDDQNEHQVLNQDQVLDEEQGADSMEMQKQSGENAGRQEAVETAEDNTAQANACRNAENSGQQYQTYGYQDVPYPNPADQNGAYTNRSYADGSYQDNQYRNNTYISGVYQNNPYQNSPYAEGSFQNNAYQGNAYQNGNYQTGSYSNGSYSGNAYQNYGGCQQYNGMPPYPDGQLELEEPVRISEWVLALVLMMIPCVNIIMMFVWAFSKTEKKSKSNFFKAYLIFYGIALGVMLVIWVAVVIFALLL